MGRKINIFVRQPFTETSACEQEIVSTAFDVIKKIQGKKHSFNFLTGEKALNKETFVLEWEKKTNNNFSPKKFRDYRISQLNKADLFINIRTNMSESSAFEIAYNVYHNKVPMFFAVWDKAPIKTTLLRELEDLCYVEYVLFSDPHEIKTSLNNFITKVASEIESNLPLTEQACFQA